MGSDVQLAPPGESKYNWPVLYSIHCRPKKPIAAAICMWAFWWLTYKRSKLGQTALFLVRDQSASVGLLHFSDLALLAHMAELIV